jgi:acyl carrier protein
MISENEFLETLTEIFRSELDDEKVQLQMQTTKSDLPNWDSLAHIRIVMRVERTYDIQLDIDEIERIDSVRGFFDAVARRQG